MATIIDNLFDQAKNYYESGNDVGSVLILLKLLKLMRKRANWPVINHKEYHTLVVVYHEGRNMTEAAKILGISRQSVNHRLKKIKKLFPDLIDQKGRLSFIPLPENYESFIKEVF